MMMMMMMMMTSHVLTHDQEAAILKKCIADISVLAAKTA
jgi:hypothetical protein